MAVERPSVEAVQAIAAAHHFPLSKDDAVTYTQLVVSALTDFDRLDAMQEPRMEVKYARGTGGYRPSGDENRYGAWAWKATVRGSSSGLLRGRRVAIKDVISVAGMPLLNGSSVMIGYTPVVDATVVTRILDAGGDIVGKATCESFSFSGGSDTSYPEPVRNPRDPHFMAGGSSSGSAALLAASECDLAIGGDQGGSIRIPSAWCGVVGLKPTFGLVPFTGAGCAELSLDTIGPMGTSVAEVAALLDVIAGADGLDPRQARFSVMPAPSCSMLRSDCRGLRIGVVEEGFGWPQSAPDVDSAVRAAAGVFAQLGATVVPISIPLHRVAATIFAGIVAEGTWSTMIRDDGMGRGWCGFYDTHYLDFFARAWRSRAADLPPSLKVTVLLGAYLTDRFHGRYYAKAQNLRRTLVEAYEDALRRVDLLVMPTTPQRALPFGEVHTLAEELAALEGAAQNTCAFNLSGQPAISVPCQGITGLPIGLMLVGRHREDATVLRAAYAYEQAG